MLISKKQTTNLLCLLMLLLVMALSLSGPVWDSDFWWHLATGKYFATEKTFLTHDIFAYTSPQEITPERRVTLNGYWLGQIIFYFSYLLGGLYGVIALRCLVFIGTFSTLYLCSCKLDADKYVTYLLLILVSWYATNFTGNRPQLFSFAFSVLLLYKVTEFIHRIETQQSLLPALLSSALIMLMWANMHRGFPLGPAIMAPIGLGLFLEQLRSDRHQQQRTVQKFSIFFVLITLVSLLNPHGFLPYWAIFLQKGSALENITSEYMPLWQITKNNPYLMVPFWLYTLTAILTTLVAYKTVRLSDKFLFIFLLILSIIAFRYSIFFILLTLPTTAQTMTRCFQRIQKSNKKSWINVSVICPVIGIVAVFSIGFQNISKLIESPIENYRFPVDASEFVLKNELPGNIYNYFEWGGFLIWKLYPKYKVFIDGRTISQQAFSESLYLLWDLPEARFLLDKYKIRTVIIPPRDTRTGEFFTIINFLQRSQEWKLVYNDDFSVIFTR